METTTEAPPADGLSESDREAVEGVNATPDYDAGASIGDMAENGEPIDEDGEGQQFLDFGDRVSLTVRGSRPTDPEVKIKAVSRPIKGQLGDQGDDETVLFLVSARLDKIEFVSKRDGDGRVTAKVRRHHLTPVSIAPIRDEAVAGRVEELVHGAPVGEGD